MLVRFVLSEESALFFAIIFSALAGIMLGNSLGYFLLSLISSVVASERIARVKERAGLFRAGLATGGLSVGMVAFLALAAGKGLGLETLWSALFALGSAALAVPMMVLALTPLVEAGFGYASDIKLLELANLNHPALKELVLQAPGTYHHSIIMGSLVESAAEAIGANPLLARSCAYYHDIGKGRNPAYFGENQKGENPHDQLAPTMSALDHQAPRRRGARDGAPVQAAPPGGRRDSPAPRHAAGGLLLPQGAKNRRRRTTAPSPMTTAFRYPGPKPQSARRRW